ncbi:MAG: P-loop domain-containing protein [Clostridium sp.]
MEAGSRLLLIDEDTSATNFMVRDDFMQQVISREKEPITPFLERAGDLYEKAGVSTILVAGSSGAFFYIADHIIQMDCYKPVEITERVKALCEEHQAPETQAPGFAVPSFAKVYAAGKSENAKVKTFGRDSFSIDREMTDLRYVEQLADFEQTSALAYLTRYALGAAGRQQEKSAPDCGGIAKADRDKGWNGLRPASMCPAGWQSREFRRFLRHWESLPGIRMQVPILSGGCVRREWGIVRLSTVAGNKSDSAGPCVSCGQEDHMNTEKKQSDYEELMQYLEEAQAYETALILFEWDEETLAPEKAGSRTARMQGVLSSSYQRIMMSDRVKELVDKCLQELIETEGIAPDGTQNRAEKPALGPRTGTYGRRHPLRHSEGRKAHHRGGVLHSAGGVPGVSGTDIEIYAYLDKGAVRKMILLPSPRF